MKPSQLVVALSALASLQQPVMVWGPPGIGKSDIVRQVADTLYGKPTTKGKAPSWHRDVDYFIDLRLALMDPTGADFRFPIVDTKTQTVRWITSNEFPRDGRGIILLDEIPQAAATIQAGASSLILDRRIGTYRLPDGWALIGTGNRDTDRAATHKMPSHIANRFTHLNLEVDAQDWIQWSLANGINPMVSAFIGFRPELLHKFDPAQKAYPTPRSWRFVSRLLESDKLDSCLLDVISGTVGEGAATEFIGFTRIFREMPDFDSIRAKPDSTKVPENVAARYAVGTMLARSTEQKDMAAVMKYIARMPKDFQLLTVNDMTRRNRKLAETSSYIAWASNNKDILLNATA